MSNNLHSLSFCVLGGGSGEERGQIFFPSVYSTSRFPLPWASCDDGGGGASSADNNTTQTGREGSRMVAATSGETKTAQTPKPKQEAFLPRGKKPKLNNNQPQHLPPPTQPRCVCGWQGSSPETSSCNRWPRRENERGCAERPHAPPTWCGPRSSICRLHPGISNGGAHVTTTPARR